MMLVSEQNKKGGVKSVNNSHSGEIIRDLPYGLMEIPPAPPAQILENAGSLGIKVGVQSSNSVAKRRFRSKNIEPSPVGPLKVIPFAGNLGKVKNGGKKKCHWCQNSESLSLTKCLSCRKLFFCAGCIKEMYILSKYVVQSKDGFGVLHLKVEIVGDLKGGEY